MSKYHRDVRKEIERFGCTVLSVKPTRGLGGHYRMIYSHNGSVYEALLAGTPSDPMAVRLKVSDIRRDLGLSTNKRGAMTMTDNVQRTIEMTNRDDTQAAKRAIDETNKEGELITLQDLKEEFDHQRLQQEQCTNEHKDDEIMKGSVAHYKPNKCLYFNFPKGFESFVSKNIGYSIERTGANDWLITPGGKRRIRKHGSNNCLIMSTLQDQSDLPFFGRADANFLFSKGHVLVSLKDPLPIPKNITNDIPTTQPEEKDEMISVVEKDTSYSPYAVLAKQGIWERAETLLNMLRDFERDHPRVRIERNEEGEFEAIARIRATR